jgi:hypothetical protein
MDRHSMPPASQAFDLDRKIIEDFGASTDPDEFLRQLNAADAAREKAMNAEDAVARGAALRVRDAVDWAARAAELMGDEAARQRMGEAGRSFSAAHKGATEKVLQLVNA